MKLSLEYAVGRVLGSAVIWGFAFTAIRGVGFLIVMAYALRRLPADDIGLWYVMLNIAGLAVIVEFGFAATIGRYASYFAGGAADVPRLGLSSTPPRGVSNQPALVGLVKMARRLYLVFGVAVGIVMLVVWLGWLQFGSGRAVVTSARILDFVVLAVGSGFNMTGMFWTAILFGLNRVRLHNQLQILGLVVNYLVVLGGLVAGCGITALVMGQLLVSLLPRLAARRQVLALLGPEAVSSRMMISWRDLWPMTWRSGAITLCSYIYIQGTTFMCSLFTDLRTTASYGLMLQMALMLHSLAAMWVWVKHPEIGALRTQSRLPEVVRMLRWRLPLSMATYVAGASCLILLAPLLLSWLKSNTAPLPGLQMAALFGLIGLDLFLGHHSAILQTGNEVPHLRVFAVSAVLMMLLVWPLGRLFHVWGVLAAPFVAQLVWSYWWTPWQCWKRLLNPAGRSALLVPVQEERA
jgi:hypothetical protein